jgi:PAS domain S-box-containing protein/putative nucleotidyltransferase with HDIG domain
MVGIDQIVMTGDALDRLDSAALLTGLDGSILGANLAALDCYGHSHVEMLTLSIHDLRASGTQDGLDRQMQKAVERGLLYEAVHRRSDGSLFPVEVRSVPVSIGGEPALLNLVRDLTAAKKAEQELEESESRYRTLAESSPLAVFVSRNERDEDRVVLANPACVKLFGASSPEDLVGMSILELFHPDSRALIRERILEVGEAVLRVEAQIINLDGTPVDVEVTASPLLDQGVAAIQVVLHDITERKQAEKELRESEEKFATAFKASPDLISVTRLSDGRIVEVNEGFLALLGYTRAESVGRTSDETWATGPAGRAEFVRLLSKTGEIRDVETAFRRKDGATVAVAVSARVFDLHGEARILSIVRDLTERKRQQQELTKQKERIENTLTSVIDIASNIVEVRDPYTAGHQHRVSELAVKIAQDLGMPDREVDDIRVAGLLHDVGKVAVPTEILSKPGRLSRPEFEIVKAHAEVGYNIIVSARMEEPIGELVFQHHERCDGSGYPRGLVSDQILRGAKVIAVADTVEAMASHRPYRSALGIEAGLAEIEQGAGHLYDADVVRSCVTLFRKGGFEFS